MIKKSQHHTLGQVRIIGGQWRGRKLPVLTSPGLRPTPDRVRETLFNWLDPMIKNARCLDCFAGSGALGLEALSRYAKSATLLELENNVAQQLINNLALLKAEDGCVINTNTLNWLAQTGQPYDVIFLDPPFQQELLTKTIYLLEKRNWLADEAWIYVETAVKDTRVDFPSHWQLHREKTAGQIVYRLYIRRT
ncbi:16S rRNA (guanine(966)-N(2))-methyltransferase [Candidatus Regiella insecticola]|uniref:Ribosomal RNA small subunit methyltransferase D n=1 Tax=Candidatus Regiella insecticola TaxID=138073 RepID=A0A6L2ZL79_9ENTR|nr:16S rRNA (guanine(966)-N(2))-methyltransferase [Candidatus Regiella insecticola]GFN45194.1 ribosomal RNA small subunit methyltransferase D [Candidatus Regiella insecticola]